MTCHSYPVRWWGGLLQVAASTGRPAAPSSTTRPPAVKTTWLFTRVLLHSALGDGVPSRHSPSFTRRLCLAS